MPARRKLRPSSHDADAGTPALAAPSMSFFERADTLVGEDDLFHGTSTLEMRVLVIACQQQGSLRRDINDYPTSLTMRRAAAASFRAQYDLSAEQYEGLVGLCDDGGGVGDVFAAYQASLPDDLQGGASGFVRRSVQYAGVVCPNESCDKIAMKVRAIDSTFYGADECYPMKHFVKRMRGQLPPQQTPSARSGWHDLARFLRLGTRHPR